MSKAPLWYYGLCWLMAVLCAVAVALQYNDPDPIRWMAIYGAAAVASAALPSARWAHTLAFVTLVAAALWAGLLVPQIWGKVAFTDLWRKMSEKGGAVEVEREFGGLVIVATWMLAALVLRKRQAQEP
jgi:Transmembrane family 220, helix